MYVYITIHLQDQSTVQNGDNRLVLKSNLIMRSPLTKNCNLKANTKYDSLQCFLYSTYVFGTDSLVA